MALPGMSPVCGSLLNPRSDVQAPHDWDDAKGMLRDLAQCHECYPVTWNSCTWLPAASNLGRQLLASFLVGARPDAGTWTPCSIRARQAALQAADQGKRLLRALSGVFHVCGGVS